MCIRDRPSTVGKLPRTKQRLRTARKAMRISQRTSTEKNKPKLPRPMHCLLYTSYASWDQNVVRQFGPYLSWAQDI